MIDRRRFGALMTAAAVSASIRPALAKGAAPRRLLFIHGRGYGNLPGTDHANSKAMLASWTAALSSGLGQIGKKLPADLDMALPYYGNRLQEFADLANLPAAKDAELQGSAPDDDFSRFRNGAIEEIRQSLGVTDGQVEAQYPDKQLNKDLQNWSWVLAVLRAIDSATNGGLTSYFIEQELRDVFIYLTNSVVRQAIDEIVVSELTKEPTVIVAHSLGSIIAYKLLTQPGAEILDVSALCTLGSPLGIRAIRQKLAPITSPKHLGHWVNAFDKHDVVSLYPLDDDHFSVDPPIENRSDITNDDHAHHKIENYLHHPVVASIIAKSLEI